MTTIKPNRYRGRFAPSPTGPLHFGSMVAAVGSYLQAKSKQGQWLVRIEDLDPPREVDGAAAAILRTLERFGLLWDESIIYQSQRNHQYDTAINRLAALGMLYPCGCSRKEISRNGTPGAYGSIYAGTCRSGLPQGKKPRALRIRTHNQPITFRDPLRGTISQQLTQEIGDFVVRRADGLFAYQLAVVVDDAEQGITEIVRGSDLLDNTPRQIYLQQSLNYPTPRYLHLPVALDVAGKKLSKQSGALPIDHHHPQTLIHAVLEFLNQTPPIALKESALDEMWLWAIQNWRPERLPRQDQLARWPD